MSSNDDFTSLCLQYLKLTCKLLSSSPTYRPSTLLTSRTLLHIYLTSPSSSNLLRLSHGDHTTASTLTATIIHLITSLTVNGALNDVIICTLRCEAIINKKEHYEPHVKGSIEYITLKKNILDTQVSFLLKPYNEMKRKLPILNRKRLTLL